MFRRPCTAVLALAALLMLCPPAHADGGATPKAEGFWNLLGVGQGETANTLELGAFLAGGDPPASFNSQRELFTSLLGKRDVGAADLGRHFKPAGFGVRAEDVVSVEEPRPGTVIRRDRFGVPHVDAPGRTDAMFGVGYAQAADRIFMMDVLRHTAQGRLTELIGPGAGGANLKADARGLDDQDYTLAELDGQIERVAATGPAGAAVKADLTAYVAGINAYIAAARRDPALVPGEYLALGKELEDWRAVDTVSIVALLTYFAPAGGLEHLNAEVLQALRARFGSTAKARRVFDDFRAANDPEGPSTAERPAPAQRYGKPARRAVALPDAGSVEPVDRVAEGTTGTSGAARVTAGGRAWLRSFALQAGGHSNALLVTASRSSTGHPLFFAGPQVDFYAPPLFWEVEVQAPGVAARGYGVPGLGPYVVIGHGPDFVFSATTAQSDLSDVVASRVCPDDRDGILVGGRCQKLLRQERTLSWTPGPVDVGAAPSTSRVVALRSPWGPVVARGTVAGKPVVFSRNRSSYGRELEGALAFAALNTGGVRSAREFVSVMGGTPAAYNWFYADTKSIAHVSAGYAPVRARGVDPDLPAWDTHAWRGFDPVRRTFRTMPLSRLPQVIDPERGWLTSWNNRAAPDWRPSDGEWQYGSTHRVMRLNRRLAARLRPRGAKIDLGDLVGIMAEAGTVDVRGQEVLPHLLAVLGEVTGSDEDRATRRARDALAAWLADGAHRSDLDGDGAYDHSLAVALMDAWWEPLARAVYEPVIGRDAVERIAAINSIDGLPKDTPDTWFHGWHAYLHKDLRRVRGARVRGPLSRAYCGRGRRDACRAILLRTLAEAAAKVGDAPRVPVTCPVATPATCDQIDFIAAGAIELAPMPWQDRGSAQQAASIVPR